jgi:hypothetical protein
MGDGKLPADNANPESIRVTALTDYLNPLRYRIWATLSINGSVVLFLTSLPPEKPPAQAPRLPKFSSPHAQANHQVRRGVFPERLRLAVTGGAMGCASIQRAISSRT